MTFIERITKQELLARYQTLRDMRPDIEATSYMLGVPGMMNWLHSVGVATDEGLRAVSPPVPPHKLRSIVAAPSESVFLWTGVVDADSFMSLYEAHAGANTKPRILDFGCGCGRMTRFFGLDETVSISGTDINPQLADWCAANLDNVSTRTNGVAPPLDYADNSFDLVYSLSIFTHLPERNALAWLQEIYRVLAPGGVAILSTHGYPALKTITGSEQHQAMFKLTSAESSKIADRLEAEGFRYLRYSDDVITMADAGDDYGNSFTHENYIRRAWSKAGFGVAQFIPGGMRGWQDVTVLKKTS